MLSLCRTRSVWLIAMIVAIGMASYTAAADEGEHEYIGSNKCKMCHIQTYKSWEKTSMAEAYETLKPGVDAEAKEAAGLDPQKDYTQDESCLSCHTVGYGKKGGFKLVDDEKELKKMLRGLAGVGCESCHGPGGTYADFHKEIKKEKMEYTSEQNYERGMTKITAETCKECHNEKSPTYKPLEYKPEKREEMDMHESTELELKKS